MAHGFLTPEEVSGESPIFGKIWNWLTKDRDKKDKKLDIIAAKVDIIQNALGAGSTPKLPPARQKILGGAATKLLSGAAGALAPKKAGIVNTQAKVDIFGRNATDIDRKEGKYLPTSDPDVAGGPKTSKGRYVNMPGVATGGLKDSSFFSKTGELDIEKLRASGKSPEEQKSIVRDYRANLRAKGVAPTGEGAPPITPDSGSDIVAAINRNTEVIVRLANLTKEQTVSQQSMHNEQQAHADKLANRALARGEEKSLERGSDLSGFAKADRFTRLLPGAGGTGGSGGGPGLGIGGKAATGALVKAVGKRGAQRVGTRLAAKYGGKAAAKTVGKYGARTAAKVGLGGAAKIGAGAIAKSAGKKIPLVGLGLGAIFAAQRALEGDFVGAGLELASGAASTVPGIGTAGSIGIDAALAARDMGMTPFARGGIITEPTNALMGEAGAEGVFPLEGRRGKNTFEMMGEGFLAAQKKNKNTFAELQSLGLKKYFEKDGGFEAFGNIFGLALGPILGPVAQGGANMLGQAWKGITGLFGGGNDAPPPVNTPTGSVASSKEEEYLLRLMIAEAGGEGELGMAAVARSVMNRAGLVQSGKVGAGTFMANSGSITDIINATNQYQPVREGKLKRALTPEETARALKALELARNTAGMRATLESKGMSSSDINNIMASTGFRTGAAFNDASQNVNRTKLGNHIFNTAGNTGMATPTVAFPESEAPEPAGSGGAAGKVVSANHPDTGSGYTVEGLKDSYGRPAVFSRGGASAFARMMKDSKGVVKGSDIASSKRSQAKNKAVGGAANSNHLGGNALDIHGESQTWMRAHGAKYGWVVNDYPGSHGGHFNFRGAGSSDLASTPAPVGGNTPGAQPSSTPNQIAATPAPGTSSTGTPIMATSAQVASASAVPTGAPTVINNYYGSGGEGQQQVNGNGVTPGIGMSDTGTAAFQELRLRSLA